MSGTSENILGPPAEIGTRRRVLFAAYFFPPLGGGGVQRTTKFVKYLEPLGWSADVVTVKAREYWVDDPTLLAEVPDTTRVFRTASLTGLTLLGAWRRRRPPAAEDVPRAGQRSSGLFRFLRRLSSFLLIPDSYVGWLPFALHRVRARLASGEVDAMITTSSPDSAHLIGLLLRRPRTIPWIADFRDPWLRRLTFHAATPFHQAVHAWLERRVIERADRVLVTNVQTRDDFLEHYPHVGVDHFEVIPNGFDPADVEQASDGARLTLPPAPSGVRLTLLHSGLLSGKRTLAPMVDALVRLRQRDPVAYRALRLVQLGPREAINDRLVEDAEVGDVVSFCPPVDHATVLAAMREADALLLLEHADPRGSLITPGKLFEYLAVGRPILAVVPANGPAAALILETGAGRVVPPRSTDLLADTLHAWVSGELPSTTAAATELAPYTRPELARRLSVVLNELVGSTS